MCGMCHPSNQHLITHHRQDLKYQTDIALHKLPQFLAFLLLKQVLRATQRVVDAKQGQDQTWERQRLELHHSGKVEHYSL